MTEQTRLKYGLVFCALVLAEGVLKHFLTGFPFEIAVAAQGAAVGVYTVAKSATTISVAKSNSRSACPPAPQDGGKI